VSKPKQRSLDVEIYDQKYTVVLQTSMDDGEVRSLANELDARMREIAAVASSPDSLKLAVLTALHLIQEHRQLKKHCEQNETLIRTKTVEWSRKLEQVLK
jgi:cell division protein ZapA